ncbi:regulator of g protein signaling [Anaeramoeba flamelloides]|uniref:Regulator of g protein signaling n=1 Tax=Anaeramoeba flamelloides TaxID=1746091 RepID=A0AAV7YP46_9EUKA|nr:regulator of g protein signaling [Anaeramoeba flamelloides]
MNNLVFRVTNTCVMFVYGSLLFFFFLRKRKHSAIKSRSLIITGFVTFSFPVFNIISITEEKASGSTQCFLAEMYLTMVQCIGIGVFLYMAARLYFIYILSREKLQNSKKFYLKVKNHLTSTSLNSEQVSVITRDVIEMKPKKEGTSDDREDNCNSNEEKESHGNGKSLTATEDEEEDWDAFNAEIELKNVEKNYYKKQFLITGKYLAIALSVHYLLFFIISMLLYFCSSDRTVGAKCTRSTWKLIFRGILAFIQLAIMVVLIIKIRKINDHYKIRNEIFAVSFVLFCYLTINYSMNLPNDRLKQDIALYTTGYALQTVVLAWPIYLSYKKTKNLGAEEETIFNKMKKLLKNKKCLQYFIEFSKTDYSVENVLFYSACIQLKKVKKKKKRKRLTENIINSFIKLNSTLTLNISSKVRKKCILEFESDPFGKTCFQTVYEEIFLLMARSTYPQFLNSKEYKEMITEINLEDQEVRFND